ncbi:MAG TPA: helix-turn-helix domain-containing protein [Thermoanaerobaculia bacterium]
MIGDRWTLLIIRELVIRERCRYTDLRDGLPGIASNLLAQRLRELEEAGIIAREEAPFPTQRPSSRSPPAGKSSSRPFSKSVAGVVRSSASERNRISSAATGSRFPSKRT